MTKRFDLEQIRARLADARGPRFWRGLDELADTEEFQDYLQHEFPQGVDQWLDPVSRRTFLKLMGASLALGGLTSCSSQPAEKIVPYVRMPEKVVPGEPLFFATATQLGGVAMGVLAESHMGRPTRIEGNPDHPGSLGASDVFSQAEVLNLYDPDRARTVTFAGQVNTWSNFLGELAMALEAQRLDGGAGLRILTETVTSPTLASQIEALLAEFPNARWHQYEPINGDNARRGALLALGEDVHTLYRFDQADVVLSLDADFMAPGPGGVRYAHDFASRRRVREDDADMNRLYVVETTPGVTGSLADHRLPLGPGAILGFVRALAAELGVAGVETPSPLAETVEAWIPALARDLESSAGRSIVVPGRGQPPLVHALAHAINQRLGNIGQTVVHTDPLAVRSVDQTESLAELTAAMAADEVSLLVILEANPVYDAPADLDFAGALGNVDLRIRLGLYEDETSALCQWHVPSTHSLESWRDARAYDGSVTLTQPLIEPLFDDKSPYQLLAAMLDQPGLTDYDIVRAFWEARSGFAEDAFEAFWRATLYNGVMAESALPARQVSLDEQAVGQALADAVGGDGADEEIELVFRADPAVWDGRFANNGWLQELPRPITKLTWDNAALFAPATAQRLGLDQEALVRLSTEDGVILAPVLIVPGQADGVVTLHLGYGRNRAGRVGTGVGVNAYRLRTTAGMWSLPAVGVTTTGGEHALATTQHHYRMEGRELVRAGTLEHFREEPDFPHHMVHEAPDISLFEGWEYESYAWGMAVDLNVCNGCNACVVACQSENNIPVVGKEQVLVGREMHWMRIDSYFEGDLDHPDFYQQPVMCQHCEQAPCELVCPVHATVHDSEGLNLMVYNRCIGTRYCSNNCPYKVRRFNFLDWHDRDEEIIDLQRNPDVTVRVRGVMEKCTYCIQRISAARIEAKKENRPIRDGEVVTACQSACPTRAIVFGDINDPDSQVSRAKAQPHNYGILTELGTRPRTSYLARLRNPNPELVDEEVTTETH